MWLVRGFSEFCGLSSSTKFTQSTRAKETTAAFSLHGIWLQVWKVALTWRGIKRKQRICLADFLPVSKDLQYDYRWGFEPVWIERHGRRRIDFFSKGVMSKKKYLKSGVPVKWNVPEKGPHPGGPKQATSGSNRSCTASDRVFLAGR